MKPKVMKKKYIISTVVALITILSACTHNDGDIGNLFGTWQICTVTDNATGETTDYANNTVYDINGSQYYYVIQFQSHVFNSRIIYPETHTFTDAFGQWQWQDQNRLSIEFPDNWWTGNIAGFDEGLTSKTYDVKALTSNRLELVIDSYTLVFKKIP